MSIQRFARPRSMSLSVAALVVGLAAGAVSGCVEEEQAAPTADDLAIIKQNLLTAPPAPKFAVGADLDGKVVYLGMDVSVPELEPGKDATLVHYWKVVEAPGDGWRMFTHVNGPDAQSFINFDHGPIRGKHPVANWKAGEIIRDEHNIRLPPTWPHDKVFVYTGIWKGNARLAVKSGAQDGQNRLLAAVIPVMGKKPPVLRSHVARLVKQGPKIDGKLNDKAWQDAKPTEMFVNTMTGEPVRQGTTAKILYDDSFLYLAFENVDDDVWGDLKNRDDKLWQQEVVEIMIDADGNGSSYVEVQTAPTGTVFDTYLPTYRKYEDSIDPKAKPFSWNAKVKAGVSVDGTLNKREDTDKGWVAEIAIPLDDVNGGLKEGRLKMPPALGDRWRINLFRLDLTKEGAQEAQGWSPPMVGDFHKLDRFGTLLFGNESGEIPAPVPPAALAASGDNAAAAGDDSPAPKGGISPERTEQLKQAIKGVVREVPAGQMHKLELEKPAAPAK